MNVLVGRHDVRQISDTIWLDLRIHLSGSVFSLLTSLDGVNG
jgi:bifunctional pyridoxal-dependent enzyme with beta-cystathionase and maltose regulon repressor activities